MFLSDCKGSPQRFAAPSDRLFWNRLALVEELKAAGRIAKGIKPERDKLARMSAQSSKFEAGFVHPSGTGTLARGFRGRALLLPYSKHDDQIDSVSQALEHSQRGISMADYL